MYTVEVPAPPPFTPVTDDGGTQAHGKAVPARPPFDNLPSHTIYCHTTVILQQSLPHNSRLNGSLQAGPGSDQANNWPSVGVTEIRLTVLC